MKHPLSAVHVWARARTFCLCVLVAGVCTLGARGAHGRGRQRGPEVMAVVLPSRRAGTNDLVDRVKRVARELAVHLGGALALEAGPAASTTADLAATLENANKQASKGALDEAAVAFDVALETGARSPQRLADPQAFVTAHVARTAIALARGEATRVDQLLERLVRYDPSFALSPAEESPRMRAALERVRTRLGPHPRLRPQDLGDACQEGLILVVGRPLEHGFVEYSRLDGCHLEATAVVPPGGSDEPVIAMLANEGAPKSAEPTPTAESPETAPPAPLAAPHPAESLQASSAPPATDQGGAPFYRKTWFWVAVGAVVAGTAVGVWAATRPDDWTVRLH